MIEAISETRPMVAPISLMAGNGPWVAARMPVICAPMSPVAFWAASVLTPRARPPIPGPRRLDGGIERQQINLFGNRSDQLDASPMRLAA
jgi:hypothetical protein